MRATRGLMLGPKSLGPNWVDVGSRVRWLIVSSQAKVRVRQAKVGRGEAGQGQGEGEAGQGQGEGEEMRARAAPD